jgi:putative ABC transport system permease protein
MAGQKPSDADVTRYRDDPRCKEYLNGEGGYHRASAILGIPVGGADVLRAIAGKTSPEAEAALANGGMVVFDSANFANGKAAIDVLSADSPKPQTVELPAVLLPVNITAAPAVLSPKAVGALGPDATTHPGSLLFNLDRLPTHAEEDRARAAIAATGAEPYFSIERGYQSNYGPGLLALLIGSALITLGAAGIATGLAQADARPDHATLSAVGAPPRVRRLLAMCSAAVIAGLGTILGIAAGFVPAAAYLGAVPDMHLIVPWASLALTVVAVPLIAALFAGLFTRSRLPLERRMA